MKNPEAEMARSVVAELQRQGYATYEEVSSGYGGKRADIVAVRGPVLAVVECKAAFSVKLLDQLAGWRGQANYIIGAHGFSRAAQGPAVRRYCALEGFGLWSVGHSEIHENVSPRLHRVAETQRLRKLLRPEMQSAEFAKAGTGGGYWTPFQGTVRALKELATRRPGVELREALREVKHHYATDRSAVSAIPELIRKGVIVGLRVEGRPLCLFVE